MTRPTAAAPGFTAHLDPFARAHLPPPSQWPELRFDLAGLDYPARLNCVAALLDAGAAGVGGTGGARMAIRSEHENWSYAQLRDKVDRIAHVLRADLGLVPGNRVLLRGANNPMMAACLLAVLKAGCVAVPTMPLLRARELAAIVDKAAVNFVLCAAGLRAELDALAAPPAMLCFGAAGAPGTLETL
ncbi:MAG TPA: 2-aminobenzoate-CoA ligase, partial [Janthinobacterium sp.]|nr:2-aminobenzoate-CoA ligase [Janthinobacterium sp.]